MSNLRIPPNELSYDEWAAWLHELADRDMPAARQAALLRLIWEEPGLIREGLINRVEFLLGRGCFEPAPEAAFQHDVAAVRAALADAGYRLLWTDDADRRGYYVEGREQLDEDLRRLIAGAVAEVDPRQIAISRRLTPAQQFQQGCSMTRLAEQVASYRLRQREPELDEAESRRVVRKRSLPR